MSIANLLVPNTIDLFANSITLNTGSDSTILLNKAAYTLVTSINVPNNSTTNVAFDTVVTSNSRLGYNLTTGIFTINTAGVFTFNTTVSYSTNATGSRYLWFIKNSSSVRISNMNTDPAPTPLPQSMSISYTDNFNIGDTLVLQGNQDNTGSSTLQFQGSTSGTSPDPLNFCQMNITMITSS